MELHVNVLAGAVLCLVHAPTTPISASTDSTSAISQSLTGQYLPFGVQLWSLRELISAPQPVLVRYTQPKWRQSGSSE